MTVQRIEFTTAKPLEAVESCPGSRAKTATALICSNPLLGTGLRHILFGTQFEIDHDISAADGVLPGHRAEPPALVIVEANRPSHSAAEVIRPVREWFPTARIVALADRFDLDMVWQARDAGADGFCLTASDREVLLTSLQLAMLGECVLPTSLVRAVLDAASLGAVSALRSERSADPRLVDPKASRLSAREAEILRCLTGGASNKMIARKLDVTEATVKVHVKAILRKLGAANRTQAAMWAMGQLAARESGVPARQIAVSRAEL